MTSKNSIYKMTVEHLRHSGWMIALSFIGSLFAGPVMLLFEYSNLDFTYLQRYLTPKEILLRRASTMSSSLSDLCGSLFLAVAMIGAVIVALGIFYYLFQSSKVDLYHSLPLTRKELFFSGYLAGFLIWFIPFSISSVITFPLAVFCAGGFQHINMLLVAFLKMLVVPLIGFIITYHLCLVAVMLSGNMANAIIATLVWGLAPIVFYGLFTIHFEQYFDTFYKFTIDEFSLCAISPIATPIVIQCFLVDDTVGGGKLALQIIVGLLIAAFNFFVAKSLYQKRKSELAGRGMESKTGTFLIRFVTAFAAGLFGVIFLYFMGINRNRIVWSIFFCIFFSVFTSAVISAVQKKTVKGLFAHKGQMLATAALSIAFILVCRFDVFGYDTYLPSKENIADAEIRINAMTTYYYYNDETFYEYDNVDVIYDLLEAGVEDSPYNHASTVVVKVNPKNGLSYYRSYSIPVTEVETLRPIIETDEYFSFLYQKYIDRAPDFSGVNLHDLTYSYMDIENAQQAQELWQAYLLDLKENYSMEEMTEYACVGIIDFGIKETNTSRYYLQELEIHSGFEHTISYIKEHYPTMIMDKDDLNIETLYVSLGLREELSVEEYYLEHLTSSDPVMITNSADENTEIAIAETTSYCDYKCEFSQEELSWLYDYIQPCRNLSDNMNADNYFYFGELELTTGNQLSCYIRKGSMSEDEIKALAARVENNRQIEEYY